MPDISRARSSCRDAAAARGKARPFQPAACREAENRHLQAHRSSPDFGKVQIPEKEVSEPEFEGDLGQLSPSRIAMKERFKRTLAPVLREGSARRPHLRPGVDHKRQTGFPGGGDVSAKTGFLILTAALLMESSSPPRRWRPRVECACLLDYVLCRVTSRSSVA